VEDSVTVWLAIACALVCTIAVIVLSCATVAHDLPEPEPDLELWAPGEDWIEPRP
jgi:hypothetical protein